jgi:hypothetical protein
MADTHVVYCGGPCRTGQCWVETKKKRACISGLRTPPSAFALTGSFYSVVTGIRAVTVVP